MLRNSTVFNIRNYEVSFLNEVLSLNAQESHVPLQLYQCTYILNEVLSLNAQEFDTDEKLHLSAHPQ